jgi:hypothetical protein
MSARRELLDRGRHRATTERNAGSRGMICPCINGPLAGWIVVAHRHDGTVEYEICPECGGALIAHCCEGDQAQPASSLTSELNY